MPRPHRGIQFVIGRPIGKTTTAVQTVLFRRREWTPAAARAWLAAEGFSDQAVDTSTDHLRYRQQPPSRFQPGSFRTIPAGGSAARNPCGSWRKRTGDVTDRAQRYRANRCIRGAAKVCHACGAKRDLMPHHLDGHEENNNPANLLTVCRACNVRAGAALRRSGRSSV